MGKFIEMEQLPTTQDSKHGEQQLIPFLLYKFDKNWLTVNEENLYNSFRKVLQKRFKILSCIRYSSDLKRSLNVSYLEGN